MSRKKQIAELSARLDQLQTELATAEQQRAILATRVETAESAVGSHDAALDATAELLRLLPAPDTVARREDLDRVESSASAATARAGTAMDRAESAATLAASAEGAGAELLRRIDAQDRTLEYQRTAVANLTERLSALEASTAQTINGIQARLAEVSIQLAHQIEELGRELDEAGHRLEASVAGGDSGSADEVLLAALDDLKATQVRLAAEQVRYELALRSELAELAARVTRPSR